MVGANIVREHSHACYFQRLLPALINSSQQFRTRMLPAKARMLSSTGLSNIKLGGPWAGYNLQAAKL